MQGLDIIYLIVLMGALIAVLWGRRWSDIKKPGSIEIDEGDILGVVYHSPIDELAKPASLSGEVLSLTGYEKSEFERGWLSLDALVHAEDQEFVQQAFLKSLASGERYRIEYRLIAQDGSEKWVLDQGRVLTDKEPVTREGMLVDITDRKHVIQQQAQQKLIQAEQQNVLLELSKASELNIGRFEAFSKRLSLKACQLVRVEKVSVWELSDNGSTVNCIALYHRTSARYQEVAPLDLSEYPNFFNALCAERVINAPEASVDKRTRELVADYLQPSDISSILVAPIRPAGQLKGMLCFESVSTKRTWNSQDTSFVAELADQLNTAWLNRFRLIEENRRRDAEQGLLQSQKMEAIGSMAAGIAHDFNNIMTAIGGYARLARMHMDDNVGLAQTCLQRLDKAAERSQSLVTQLMKFGQHHEPEVRQFNVIDHLSGTVDFLKAILPSSIELKTDFDDQILNILFDADQLEQVLINLAMNARDAMNDEGTLQLSCGLVEDKELYCSCCQHSFTGEYVKISSKDTGKGIPEEVLPHIFEPFFTTKGDSGGTGLGLAMVGRLLHEYGGHIHVSNAEDGGAGFDVYLPRSAALSVVDTDSPVIVVVDDDTAAAAYVSELLHSHGYANVMFNQSRQAEAWIKEHPNLVTGVVSDYAMPDMDGLALATSIYEQAPSVPVILITGFVGDVKGADLQGMNVVSMLKKPLDSAQFLDTIGDYFNPLQAQA